jgi:diadenosine tetraphosphate (Ap4A) HIT family hydrolase
MSSGSYQMRKNQKSRCEFCDEFAGSSKNEFVARYGSRLGDRLLFNGRYFRIVPSLGQIVEGHLLVIPVEHHRALADLPHSRAAELDDLCRYTRSVLTQKYGSCVLFEHGARGEGSGGCGIDHAHMHAVPVMADGVLSILAREFTGGDIASLAEIPRLLAPGSSYLYFEDASRKRYAFPVQNLPSQYMRKLVADSIGKTDWDWRECGREPELLSTLQHLPPLFCAVAIANKG